MFEKTDQFCYKINGWETGHNRENICQYKVLEEIGAGGMGIVYKALDTKLDRFTCRTSLDPRWDRLKNLPGYRKILQDYQKRVKQ